MIQKLVKSSLEQADLPGKTIGFQLRSLTHTFFFGNSCNSLSIQRTQFPLRLSWAFTMLKAQGPTLSQAVVSFNLEKQKTFKLGQMHVALIRIRNLQRLFLTGIFCKEVIKASADASKEFDKLLMY